MISLSDDELSTITRCSMALPPGDRDAFMRDVAAELERAEEIGPGICHRIAARLQRQYLGQRVAHRR